MNQPPTVRRQAAGPRWVFPFLAALVTVLDIVGIADSASAAFNPTAGIRVGAHDLVVHVLVESPEHIAAGQRIGTDRQRVVTVVANGVAANGAARACRTNSFTGDTLVLMADGTRKPIKDVKLGDKVIATDPETGETGPHQVIDLIRHGGLHTMAAGRLSDGTTIAATDRHPFWVESRGEWVDAIELQPGDVVVTADGDRLTVESLAISEEDLTAYNLTVDGLHTYFVGSESVLVHNCIRNSHLAGSTHPKSGVPFDQNGFPDFSAWRHPDVSDVRIQLTGSRSGDFRLANQAAGLTRTPSGYTWHHHQDAGLMQLIRTDIHRVTGHTGGFSMR